MYSFTKCLEASYRVNWTIAEVLDGRGFDTERPWLPPRLSGAGAARCLDEDERRKLTHVELGAYAHLFSVVEEFIAPKMTELAHEHAVENRAAFDALTNFASEEVKHMTLFRTVREMVDATVGFPLERLDEQAALARFVLARSTGGVLLLTSIIEWFTQLHYVSAFKDDFTLDPLTRRIFKHHWQEEAQHAKIDHLETLRAFAGVGREERERAIDDLIELIGALDELLGKQAALDVGNLARYLDRSFDETERADLLAGILRAKRYAFLESGLTHPNFQGLYTKVTTPEQRGRVAGAVAPLLGAAAG